MPKGQRGTRAKIERSAEALRVYHHPITFPSKQNLATRGVGDYAGKKQRSGVEDSYRF